MTATQVRSGAQQLGFELEEVAVDADLLMWTWCRGNDRSWPAFPSQAAALSWMDHALRSASLFNR